MATVSEERFSEERFSLEVVVVEPIASVVWEVLLESCNFSKAASRDFVSKPVKLEMPERPVKSPIH